MAKALEITTYRDIPYQARFQLGSGEGEVTYAVAEEPEKGTVAVDGAPADSDAALGKLFLVGEKNLYPDDMKVKRALDTAAVFYPDFDRSYA